MAKLDYYTLLGIGRNANVSEIKRAFRRLAMEYHPDRNPNDKEAEQRFKDVTEAYDVLKNQEKRATYDRFGHEAFEHGGQGRGGFGFSASSFSDVFEDLFGEVMGGGRQRSSAQRGDDLKYQLDISLEEAFSGTEVSINLTTSDTCGACSGSGAELGTKPEVCPSCGGRGKIRLQQGFFMMERTCASCRGAGQTIGDPCKNCNGQGRVQQEKSLVVKIPKGVEEGTRIRLTGEGEAGYQGGPSGDLYIFIAIKPHPLFQREGPTIYCKAPISVATAALGGEIDVPSIEGKRSKLKLSAGTQTGQKFRMRKMGMPRLNSSHVGDMVVEVEIETPVALTRAQKDLLKKFDQASSEKSNPKTTTFLTRIRKMLGETVE